MEETPHLASPWHVRGAAKSNDMAAFSQRIEPVEFGT
jgi:hypothetical protein